MKKITIADIERVINVGQTHEILPDGSLVPKKTKPTLKEVEQQLDREQKIKTSERIERIFIDLTDLIKTGQFTSDQLYFMENFLSIALNSTKKVIARTKIKDEEKNAKEKDQR